MISISSVAYGQITFTDIPKDSELVARNIKTNLGTIIVNGEVNKTKTSYNELCLKIYRDKVLIDSLNEQLNYSPTIAPFDFSYQIPAELKEYQISLYGIANGIQKLDTTINAIVAGDVYVIEGQSNAFASMRDKESSAKNKSEFIRTFGSADSSVAGLLHNLKWYRGEGDGGFKEKGHIGQWGLRLGKLIVDSIKIPVAIFNGAFGGTPISYYERPLNYQSNLHSNYARLYYRLALTGVLNDVRGIIWSQGETDAINRTTASKYKEEFYDLITACAQDFHTCQKFYIFQTDNGCGSSINNVMEIKEVERQLAAEHGSSIEIISTSALKHDKGGCHFDYKGGYEEFGNRIFNLIARDLYGIKPQKEIEAPMITSAYMSDSTTLVVVEKADSLIQHDIRLPIQSYEIENAKDAKIDTIDFYKNIIIFELSQYPGNKITVYYLAQSLNSVKWLTNTNNFEVLCFYKYPVNTQITESKKDITCKIKVRTNLFNKNSKVLLNSTGKHFLEVVDTKKKKKRWYAFTGKKYILPSQDMAKGLYSVRAFDKDMNTIGITKFVIR